MLNAEVFRANISHKTLFRILKAVRDYIYKTVLTEINNTDFTQYQN